MDPEPPRVVVTGVGAVSAAGPTALDYWKALLDARLCATPLTRFDPGRPAVAGQVEGDAAPSGLPPGLIDRLSRSARFALDAAIQAVADSRIELTPENAHQVAALIGTAHGPGGGAGEAGWALFSTGLAGLTAGLNIAGPSHTIAADGASGLIAIGQARALIRSGAVKVAVAGGAEAPLVPAVWAALQGAGLLSSQDGLDAQRPFDLLRDGLVPGEGAAVLVLEDRDVAVARGARMYAEILGFAETAGPRGDGHPPTDVDIARRALGGAMRDAAISPQQVDVLFAAGTGTQSGDAREVDILERSFGARILDIYVTTVTPVAGYTVGATGAMAAAAAAFSLAEQVVPPHAGLRESDPDCALDFAAQPQRDHLLCAAICAYGAAGQNAALIVGAAGA